MLVRWVVTAVYRDGSAFKLKCSKYEQAIVRYDDAAGNYEVIFVCLIEVTDQRRPVTLRSTGHRFCNG